MFYQMKYFFYRIDPNPKYKKLVKKIFKRIIARKDNPKGIYNKHISGTRPMKNFAPAPGIFVFSDKEEGYDHMNDSIGYLIEIVKPLVTTHMNFIPKRWNIRHR